MAKPICPDLQDKFLPIYYVIEVEKLATEFWQQPG